MFLSTLVSNDLLSVSLVTVVFFFSENSLHCSSTVENDTKIFRSLQTSI